MSLDFFFCFIHFLKVLKKEIKDVRRHANHRFLLNPILAEGMNFHVAESPTSFQTEKYRANTFCESWLARLFPSSNLRFRILLYFEYQYVVLLKFIINDFRFVFLIFLFSWKVRIRFTQHFDKHVSMVVCGQSRLVVLFTFDLGPRFLQHHKGRSDEKYTYSLYYPEL